MIKQVRIINKKNNKNNIQIFKNNLLNNSSIK